MTVLATRLIEALPAAGASILPAAMVAVVSGVIVALRVTRRVPTRVAMLPLTAVCITLCATAPALMVTIGPAGVVSSGVLCVMAFAIDVTALVILCVAYVALLVAPDVAVRARICLAPADVRLAALEPCGFVVGQIARAYTIGDAPLLVGVTCDIVGHALGRTGMRIAALAVMRLAVNLATETILHPIDAACFVAG